MSVLGSGRRWVFWAGFVLACAGCQTKESPPAASGKPGKVSEASVASKSARPAPAQRESEPAAGEPGRSAPVATPPAVTPPAAAGPVEEPAAAGEAPGAVGQVEPADLVMPKVLLTEAQAATCLVRVGDPMPAIALADLAGKEQMLSRLLGERLTVVTFWRSGNPYALAELADLGPDVAQPFGRRGVRVVAIDEQDPPDVVRQIAQKLGLKFPVLLDAHGQALSQVATRRLPRTYLLDAGGKIVWFDMEYSRSTWRDLHQAIQFLLSQD